MVRRPGATASQTAAAAPGCAAAVVQRPGASQTAADAPVCVWRASRGSANVAPQTRGSDGPAAAEGKATAAFFSLIICLHPAASGAEAEQAARADAARMAAQVQETLEAVRSLEGHLDPSSELARLGRRYRAAAEAHGAAHAAWSVVASEGAAQHRGTDGESPSPSSSQASHAWRIGWRTWTRHAGQDTSSRF